MKRFVSYLFLALSLLSLSAVASARSACCEKYKDKPSYSLEYKEQDEVKAPEEIKELQQRMSKNTKMRIKMLSIINATEENAEKQFQVAFKRVEEIKKQIVASGVEENKMLMQVKVFIGPNNHNMKDKVLIYENKNS